jgi:hypothetical protein
MKYILDNKSVQKYKLDKLQENGTLFCLEAFVKPLEKNISGFNVFLAYESSTFSEYSKL